MSHHNQFPLGWDEHRVKRVLEHYENQSDEDAVAEDEEAFDNSLYAIVQVPRELLAAVRALLSRGTAV